MGKFIQIIEIQTSKIDEVKAIGERVQKLQGTLSAEDQAHGTICADRDRPGTYFNIVEFSSYESAMKNSNSPEVQEFSAEMAKLCDAPPKFYNLDIVDQWSG